MPLDKNMSHEDMVAELMASYKKNGYIGATQPRDEKHALQIANAVAYNIGESKEIKDIPREVTEMKLSQILESLESYLTSKEKELGISNEDNTEGIVIDSSLHKGEEAKYYQENLQGKTVVNPVLGEIQLLGKGRKETLFRSPAKYMGILCYVDKIIETGYSNGIEDSPVHNRENDSITGFYYIYDNVIYDGKKLDVKLTICVDIDGKKYYMFDANQIKENLNPTRLMSKRQSIKEVEVSNNIITDDSDDVKPGDKFKLGDFIEITVLEAPVKNYEEALENPKVKVTLDSGETFETEVDPATPENELEKQYKTGTEINVGKEGQERKAKIKSATLTKQVGEDFEEDNKYYDIFKNMDLDKEALQHSLKVLKANKKGSKSQEQIDAIEKILKEDLENPPAVIENPIDVISLDIPLLMRLLEWSREQAGEDVDLHVLTENLVEAMKDTEFLTMDDYERLVPCEECTGEEKPVSEDYNIGTKFIRGQGKRKDVEEIVDILKTYNSKGDLVKTEYVTEHDFAGQKVIAYVPEMTIARGQIIEECDGEYNLIGESFSEDRADIERTYGVDLSKNLKFDGLDEIPDEWSEFIEDSNHTFNNVQDLFNQKGYIIEKVNEPTIETNYITFRVFKDQMGAKPTGVMEVTRVDLLRNNAYDIAYKIQKELEDRYPSILECDGSCATTSSDMGADQILPFGKINKVKELKNKKFYRTVKSK